MKKNKLLKNLLKVLISLLILGVLVYKLDITKIYSTLSKITVIPIILILLHYGFTIFFNALGLGALTNALDLKIRFKKLLKYYILAYSIGRFTPAKAGEFSLVHFLSKGDTSHGKSLLITLVYKLITIFVLSILSIMGFFLFFPERAIDLSLLIIGIIVVMGFLMISSRIREIIKRRILKKKASKFRGFSKSLFYLLKEKKSALLWCFLIITLRVFLTAITIWAVFLSLNINVPILTIMIINALGLIITLIPISISGLGIKEAATVFLYSKLDIDAVISGSIYLLLAFFHFAISALILLFFILKKRKH